MTTTFKFSEPVLAKYCLAFVRRDGQVVRVDPHHPGKVITPVEYSHLYQNGRYTGQMLVAWDGLGWFWCQPDDVAELRGRSRNEQR